MKHKNINGKCKNFDKSIIQENKNLWKSKNYDKKKRIDKNFFYWLVVDMMQIQNMIFTYCILNIDLQLLEIYT